jgi:hypothetical protein
MVRGFQGELVGFAQASSLRLFVCSILRLKQEDQEDHSGRLSRSWAFLTCSRIEAQLQRVRSLPVQPPLGFQDGSLLTG